MYSWTNIVAGGLQLEAKPGVESLPEKVESHKQGGIKRNTNEFDETGEKTVSTDQTDDSGADDQQSPVSY